MTTEPSSVTGIKLGHSTILWIHVFGFSVFILLRLVYRTPTRRRYYNPNNLKIIPKKCFTTVQSKSEKYFYISSKYLDNYPM